MVLVGWVCFITLAKRKLMHKNRARMKVIFERIIKPGNQPQIQFKMDGWIYIFGGSFQKSMRERL